MFWRRKTAQPEPPKEHDSNFEEVWTELQEARATRKVETKYQHLTDRHFELSQYIEKRYKQRGRDPEAFDDVIRACEEMISIAPQVAHAFREIYGNMGGTAVPPTHLGYKRLIITRRNQGDLPEAERLQEEFERVWRD